MGMEQNKKLEDRIEELLQNKAESEEMEQELRLINETYKYTQLSDKQQITNLNNTLSAYKTAAHSSSKTLDTLNNELETIKNRNALIIKENTQLKQTLKQSLNENTKIKQLLIEKNAEMDALSKNNNELQSKLSLSQQLNSPHTTPQNSTSETMASPIASKQSQQNGIGGDTEERLQRIHAMMSQNIESLNIAEIRNEFAVLMEEFHPINMAKTSVSGDTNTASFELVNKENSE